MPSPPTRRRRGVNRITPDKPRASQSGRSGWVRVLLTAVKDLTRKRDPGPTDWPVRRAFLPIAAKVPKRRAVLGNCAAANSPAADSLRAIGNRTSRGAGPAGLGCSAGKKTNVCSCGTETRVRAQPRPGAVGRPGRRLHSPLLESHAKSCVPAVRPAPARRPQSGPGRAPTLPTLAGCGPAPRQTAANRVGSERLRAGVRRPAIRRRPRADRPVVARSAARCAGARS